MKILDALANLMVGYFDSIFYQPFDIWLYQIPLWIGLAALFYLAKISIEIVSGKFETDEHNSRIYSALCKCRRARDLLGQAIEELFFTAPYTTFILVGKVLIPQHHPADYPDPGDARELIAEVIGLLDKKKVKLDPARQVYEGLPDIVEIAFYRNQRVDNRTFAEERTHLDQLRQEVRGEIKHYEQILPRNLPLLIIYYIASILIL